MTTPLTPEIRKGTGKYQEFQLRQVARILARGGSNQDVARWLQHVEKTPLHDVMIAEATPDPDAATPMPGTLAGMSMAAWQGLTFGFGDEALGGLVGLATLATTGDPIAAQHRMEQTREGFRDQMGAFRGTHPAQALIGGIAGGMRLPIAAARGVGATSALGRIGAGALAGAGAGALAGAGEADAELGARTKGALFGGAVGSVLGAGVAGAANVVGAATKRLVGTKLVQTGITAVKNWTQQIRAEAQTSAQAHARRLMASALREGGTPISILLQRARQAQRAGMPVGVADIADEPVLALGQAAQALRGPAKRELGEALAGRTSEVGPRLLGNMFTSMRMGLKNAYDAADELVAQRAATSRPLYEAAHQLEVRVTPRLARLLKEQEFRDAYLLGQRAAHLEDEVGQLQRGLAIPNLPDDPRTLLTLPIRALDYMKQSLDEVIEAGGQAGRPIVGRRSAMALRAALNDVLDEVDVQAPVYAAARAAFRGKSELLDALARGRGGLPNHFWPEAAGIKTDRFIKRDSEIIRRELMALKTADEKAMYRIGAMQDLADAIHSMDPSTVPTKLFGGRAHPTATRQAEERIRALYDDPSAAQDFMDLVHNETLLTERARELAHGGAPLGTAADELTGAATAPRTIRMTPGGHIKEAVRRMRGTAQTRWAEEVSDEVSSLLAKGLRDPQDLVTLLEVLEPAVRTLARPTQRAIVGGALVGEAAQQRESRR